MDSASLEDASAELLLLRYPPFLARSAGAEGGWGEGEGQPSPPAPLPHCGSGEDLVDRLGIVERRRRRIATATLPPFLARSAGAEGGWGEGEGAALTPGPAPALRERGGSG